MIVGLLCLTQLYSYIGILIGLGWFAIGQGLYRMSLRRDLAHNPALDAREPLHKLTYFMLSTVIAPIIAYPLGFFLLNIWPKTGIFYIALGLSCLLGLPLLLSILYHQQASYTVSMKKPILWARSYLPMCIITILLISLNSILIYSAPLILYQGTTYLPWSELVAMSVSGLIGLFAHKIFSFSKKIGLQIGCISFGCATAFLYLTLLKVQFSGIAAIILFSFANGIIFPIILSLPVDDRWHGNLDGRFIIHSVAMALGSIVTIAISAMSLLNPHNLSHLTIGLLVEVLIVIVSIVVIIFIDL